VSDVHDGFDAARRALTEQLEQIDEQLRPYEELVEARKRASRALAVLDTSATIKKRVRWEDIAEYVQQHPGSKAGEIAAGLEVPVTNIYAHLERNADTVFDKRKDGIHLKDGWQAHRRD
jgi:hypothetical protein